LLELYNVKIFSFYLSPKLKEDPLDLSLG